MLLHILRINLQLSLARCELLWRQRMDLQLCNKFYGCRSIVVMSLAHFSRGNGGFWKMFCSLNGILIASENFVDLHSQQLILFIILLPDSRFPFACLYMGMHTNIYTLDRLTTSTAIETCDKLASECKVFFFPYIVAAGCLTHSHTVNLLPFFISSDTTTFLLAIFFCCSLSARLWFTACSFHVQFALKVQLENGILLNFSFKRLSVFARLFFFQSHTSSLACECNMPGTYSNVFKNTLDFNFRLNCFLFTSFGMYFLLKIFFVEEKEAKNVYT